MGSRNSTTSEVTISYGLYKSADNGMMNCTMGNKSILCNPGYACCTIDRCCEIHAHVANYRNIPPFPLGFALFLAVLTAVIATVSLCFFVPSCRYCKPFTTGRRNMVVPQPAHQTATHVGTDQIGETVASSSQPSSDITKVVQASSKPPPRSKGHQPWWPQRENIDTSTE